MTNNTPNSPYLDRPIRSMVDVMASDARNAGLGVTTSNKGVLIVGGLAVRSFRDLRAMLDIHAGLDPDHDIRAAHEKACKRRHAANSPW